MHPGDFSRPARGARLKQHVPPTLLVVVPFNSQITTCPVLGLWRRAGRLTAIAMVVAVGYLVWVQ